MVKPPPDSPGAGDADVTQPVPEQTAQRIDIRQHGAGSAADRVPTEAYRILRRCSIKIPSTQVPVPMALQILHCLH